MGMTVLIQFTKKENQDKVFHDPRGHDLTTCSLEQQTKANYPKLLKMRMKW